MEAVPTTPARIADVAAHAGVGIATVSRVLNDRGNVAAATRERVLEAIRILEYRPSSVAQALSLKRTLVIGVVAAVPHRSVADRACPRSRHGARVVALRHRALRRRVGGPAAARVPLLADAHRTDGLLVVSLIPPDEEVRRLGAGSIPCVLIDAHHDGVPSVVIDDVGGGELATRYLVELGHRRIAFIGDKPADPFRRQSSRDRTIGYERALAAAAIPVRREYVREGTQSRHVARNIAQELLRLAEPPSAVFAASDVQALGVLEAARGLGIDVPDQLSVIGFDDIEIASYVGLTTVRQPLFESGRRGAELLLQALAGQPAPVHVETLPLDLVVRGTTRPPR